MKRFLPILLLTGFSSPVMADITHKLSSSIQLQVNAAATQVERIGSKLLSFWKWCGYYGWYNSEHSVCWYYHIRSYGSWHDCCNTGCSWRQFQLYSQTYIQGDAVSQSAPTVGQVSNFSDQVSTAAGTAGDLAGTITTAGVMTITAGGAGTVATGQFVNELTVQ